MWSPVLYWSRLLIANLRNVAQTDFSLKGSFRSSWNWRVQGYKWLQVPRSRYSKVVGNLLFLLFFYARQPNWCEVNDLSFIDGEHRWGGHQSGGHCQGVGISEGHAKWYHHFGRKIAVSYETEHTLIRLAIAHLGIYPNLRLHKNQYTAIYSSFITNLQNLKANKISFCRWMDEQTVAPLDHGIIFSTKGGKMS